MKNILFLLDYYQENNSANGVCCRNVAECLAKKEYGVFVGCYRPLQAPAEQMQNGVHVIKTWTMPDGPVHKTLKGKISAYLCLFFFFFFFFFAPACRSGAVARRGKLPLGLQNY